MTKFVESVYVTKMREVTRESYERYWDERRKCLSSLDS